MIIGLVGAPNKGKSSFFKAATLANVKIADYPFTTIDPNIGVGYVRTTCPCKELHVTCNPENSSCINGVRFVPFKLYDVAGLIPGAHKGLGMGNEFLDDLRVADALIIVTDISGTTDEKGEKTTGYDSRKDYEFLTQEFDEWIFKLINADFITTIKKSIAAKKSPLRVLAEKLSGLGIKEDHVLSAAEKANFTPGEKSTKEEIYKFATTLRQISKPLLICANKMDMPSSEKNYELLKTLPVPSVPCSAVIEIALRKAAGEGIINYLPGDSTFGILKSVTEEQKKGLELINEYLKKHKTTGVEEALNKTVFDLLKYVVVYPVTDENKYTNTKGKVLPDAFLLPYGSTALNLAFMIHTDIGSTFIKAIDCRAKKTIGKEYKLKNGDVIKIISQK